MTQTNPTSMSSEDCVGILSDQAFQSVAELPFEKKEYPLYLAEFALKEGNIIFHFFPKDTTKEKDWLEAFPEILSKIAQEYWNATYPRLEAMYTKELVSWCLIANGFAERFDPEGRSRKFLDLLSRDFQSVLRLSSEHTNPESPAAEG